MEYSKTAAINMVKGQVAPNRVTNSVIMDAMAEIPREFFILEHYKDVAYIDDRLPMGEGRFILPPSVFARMLQTLDLQSKDKVLDVACGSGYSSIIIARLAGQVIGIDNIASLITKAHKYINKIQEKKVAFKNGELLGGDSQNAPFDAIFVNGTFKKEPEELLSQLKVGGRLVMLLADKGLHKVMLYTKTDEGIDSTHLFDATAALL